MTASKPYRISVSLAGHSADVRSLSSSPHPSNDHPTLFSSSRDGTARSWFRSSSDTVMEGNSEVIDKGEGGADWKEGSTFTGQHDGFVNAVKWLKGNPSSEGSDRGKKILCLSPSLRSAHRTGSGSQREERITLVERSRNPRLSITY